MKLTPEQLKTIDATIKSIAQAQAERFFKSEHNTKERSLLVGVAIAVQIGIALLDGGLTVPQLAEIDPSDEIAAAMLNVGFTIDEEEDLKAVFGPEPIDEDCVNCSPDCINW